MAGKNKSTTGAASRKRGAPAAKARKGRTKAKAVLERVAAAGWRTSDEDEIAMRRWRGQTEIGEVVALTSEHGFFGDFRVGSAGGRGYDVEIRSLSEQVNSCGCVDAAVNGLGTCKHIEGTLAALRRGKSRAFRAAATEGSAFVEIFLDRRGEATPGILWPAASDDAAVAQAREWLAPYLGTDGRPKADPEEIARLIDAVAAAPEPARARLRVSRGFAPWIERARRNRARVEAAAAFRDDLAAGRETLDILKLPLLPYQRTGAIHLAFGERALLADDMGLGKTIQAIAACELLARRKKITKVLVVCPTSLKAEWEEQIARFCGRDCRLVFGSRAQRLAAYGGAPAFFTVVNYEQVASDADDVTRLLAPDVVVLDEAQRIKNWRTKTARQVKALRAAHAFVLTGTPIENRIDELYSIVQYLDPDVFGSLFRFNRDFYELDERGRPVDYKNLAQLRERIAPLMLRRRKAEVEKELPGRTVKTYLVPMCDEQKLRYEDYSIPAARLIAQAQKRPLRQQEFERLQQLLACMRMVCDTPAILDPACRVSPKLEELEKILGELLEDEGRKIIIFSEWERMLTMIRELAAEMGVEAAWHTGSVTQERRRAEINRFKRDPACRLFLSTDSGGVGLNLQVASAVINIDLPWNPAKFEQRIARAWRKNQQRSVSVVNLVAEGTIEHNILHLIGQKQALADGVLDGEGDLSELKMPSGRAAFIERMQAMMERPRIAPRIVSAQQLFVDDLLNRLGEHVLLVEERRGAEGAARLLVVLDADDAALAEETARVATLDAPAVDLMDLRSWRATRRLAEAGLLRFSGEPRELHRSSALPREDGAPAMRRGGDAMAEADRTLRMARTLAEGGFPEEAPPLLARALRAAAQALLAARGEQAADSGDEDLRRLVACGALPDETLPVLEAMRVLPTDAGVAEVAPLLSSAARIVATIRRNEPSLCS
ncbi:DEAD/DEAH box helicase [Methylosinus sp. Sm6]|uniref:DEAD/DEAH box helicase n=1 Tax=Methylosinus sp. Sm6 TaxID=2866948 RepID=UPI001C9952C9|nr:DEAD/DEAH box helicase [Methylosinus sp. Sm6]MBY6240292.1 DEAD/DEAH box helicase [Methylosinus sp. Sm6]